MGGGDCHEQIDDLGLQVQGFQDFCTVCHLPYRLLLLSTIVFWEY